MDYPLFRPVTKPSYKQQISHRNNFAEHNFNYVNRSKTTKPSNMNSQKLLIFAESKKKNSTKRYHTRNQPPYYTTNYFPSDNEEYYNQNHQRF